MLVGRQLFLMLLSISAINTLVMASNVEDDGSLSIAAFNIQVFGRAKASNEDVMDTIVKIVQRYDICLVQEIRDSSGEAIDFLLNELNKGTQQYELALSDRLGRTTSKEQYAFLYKSGVGISVLDTYQDPDHTDVFEREPYAVRFHVETAGVQDFVLIAIHTSPGDAFAELNALKDVHDDILEHWGIDDILILGDFNADCSYVSKKKMNELLLNTPDYHWLISEDADTTVGASDCAYDRFVMTGEKFLSCYIPNSAKVFYFDAEYGLSDEQAKAVSDHYPIELLISAVPVEPVDDFGASAVGIDDGVTDESEDLDDESNHDHQDTSANGECGSAGDDNEHCEHIEDEEHDFIVDDYDYYEDEDYIPSDDDIDDLAQQLDEKLEL